MSLTVIALRDGCHLEGTVVEWQPLGYVVIDVGGERYTGRRVCTPTWQDGKANADRVTPRPDPAVQRQPIADTVFTDAGRVTPGQAVTVTTVMALAWLFTGLPVWLTPLLVLGIWGTLAAIDAWATERVLRAQAEAESWLTFPECDEPKHPAV